ncbi:MAG: hypothetical protein LBR60_07445 [Fibrobacter sp.]|nr:hypothetical protein [Fibrobacter sp.]
METLVQKVEKALETVRALKADKVRLESEVRKLKDALLEAEEAAVSKNAELNDLKMQAENREMEILELQDTVKNQENELSLAAEKFEHMLSTIEKELGTEFTIAQDAETSNEPPQGSEFVEETVSEEKQPSEEEGAQPTFFG